MTASAPPRAGAPIPERPPSATARPGGAWPARVLPACCVALGLAVLLLPVALTPVPPLLDYPNHLARVWLLAGGIEGAPLDAVYAIDWSGAWTNIGIDLAAVTLGRLTGGLELGPWLLAAALVLPPLGAVLLNRAVFGGWHWWQAGFAVLAWNGTLLAGFLNFQIGMGLAFAAAASDGVLLRRFRPVGAMAARVGIGTGLLAVHPFGTALYGVLLAALAFGGGRVGAGLAPRLLRGVATAGLAAGLPVVALFLLAPVPPGSSAWPQAVPFWELYKPSIKAGTLLSPILTYDRRLDVAVVALLWAAARVVPAPSLFRFHAGLGLAAAGLLVLALACPTLLGGTAFVDWRFPIMALLMLVAAVRPETSSVRAGRRMAAALAVLAMARTAWIGTVWHERQSDVAALRDVLALVPAGAAVAPVEHEAPPDAPMPRGRLLSSTLATYRHLPALAVPWRHAFVPTLFATPGKQPLRVLPPWSEISVIQGGPAPAALLHGYVPDAVTDYLHGFVRQWRERFDYVLVLNPGELGTADEASVPGLELLADRGFVQLYRVHREQ